MDKTFKKVLAVVLSLVMVVTSITVYKSTARADDGTWSITDYNVAVSGTDYVVNVWYSAYGNGDVAADPYFYSVFLDEESDGNRAIAANGWDWGKAQRHDFDTVMSTVSGNVTLTPGSTHTVIIVAYQLEDDGSYTRVDSVSQEVTIPGEEITTTAAPETTPATEGETEIVTQDEIDVDAIADWVQLNGVSKAGTKAYVSQAVAETFGNAGLRGFYDAGTSPNWNITEAMKAVPVFGFVTAGANASAVVIDGVKYANDSVNTCVGNDCVYINQNLFELPAGVSEKVFIVTAVDSVIGNGTGTFAVKIVGESAPDTSTVDISEWVEIPVSGSNAANVEGKYYMNKASYDAYVNTAIWGVYAPASSTAYHGGDCALKGDAISFANKNDVAMTAIWVDGVRYVAGSDKFHARGDSCEMALELFGADDDNIHYVAVVGGNTTTLAIKYEAPKAEVAPDQTLDEVTDWIMVGTTELANNVSADGNNYYVSEAFRNETFNYIDLFGLYTDHTTAPYHPANCTLTDAVYVSAIPSAAGTMKSVWIDGVKYASGTENCYIDGDQIHLAQSLFALPAGETEKTFAVTVRTDSADYTYALKVAVAPEEETTQPSVTKYNVTVDGKAAAEVEEGQTYTLPTEAAYGYFDGTNMYKAGATVTVNSDMAFTSVNDLSVTVAQGAGIKLDGANTSGIRFQAAVASSNMDAVASDAITEGMLITANNIFENNDSVMDLTSTYTLKNIPNSGWYNGVTGTYCGSIVNIVESNYIRNFIARAYVTVNYADGETVTVYSGMSSVRSIQYVAAAIKGAGYSGIDEAYKSIIDTFAAAN